MNISKKSAIWLVALVLLTGFALRLHGINRVSLRGDEAFTLIHWVREPLDLTLFGEVAVRDPQPPLAYATYFLWGKLVGTGIDTLRFLPALLNLIGAAAAYALGKRLHSRQAGAAAALLFALHPLQIWHAQDARNYAIWGAFTGVSLWLALRALRSERRVDWALYIVSAALSAYLYYLELFVVAALNIYVFTIFRRETRVLSRWFVSQFVLALLLAPWFLQERLLFGSGYGGTAGGFQPHLLVEWFLPTLLFGETSFLVQSPLFSWALLFVLSAIFYWLWMRNRSLAWLVLLLILVPVIGLAFASLRLNVFVPRYIMSVVYPLVLLVSVFAVSSRRLAGIFVGSIFVFLMFQGYFHYANDYAKSPDWNQLTLYLESAASSDDIVINTSADEAYTLYHTENEVPADIIRLPANPQQSDSEIQAELTRILAEYRSIWLVADTPADWGNAGVAEAWLDQNAQHVTSDRAGGLRVLSYRPFLTPSPALPTTPQAVFQDVASLLDAEYILPPNQQGDLTVLLVWNPEAVTPAPLKVFVHLVETTGSAVVSQDDQFPYDGVLSTTSWVPGEPIRDIYHIPLRNVPDGEYRLTVGWYDAETGQRIMETSAGEDHSLLAHLMIADNSIEIR